MIHIFGDSFGDNIIKGLNLVSPNSQWVNILKEKLQQNSKTYALGGSSLEFTFEQFYKNCDTFNKNDIIIIILTSSNRHYFFPTWPQCGSIQMFYTLSPKHLINERRAWTDFESFLNSNNDNTI